MNKYIKVYVICSPVTTRYCKVGDTAQLDIKNKQIRCSGAWFSFDGRWSVITEEGTII